jgi:glutamine cyclotransferase
VKQENFDAHGFGIEKIWLKAAHQYTQGFRYLPNGDILESTGIYGKSHLQYLRPDTCGTGFHIVRSDRESLKSELFGEGADVIRMGSGKKYVFQLTWKNRRIFVYEARNLKWFRTLWMPRKIGQGWGLTSNPETRQIYVTNGSSSVFLCQASLTKDAQGLSKVKFRCDNGNPVKMPGSQTGPSNLNEFEYRDNSLYTNEYMTDNIHKINAKNFTVSRTWDMAALRAFTNKLLAKENSNALKNDEVLNGITWDPKAG